LSSVDNTGEKASRVYLFIGDGSGPRLRRVGRFHSCKPRYFEESGLSKEVERIGRSLGPVRRRAVVLWAFVQADGGVGEVRVEESSGDLLFDVEVAKLFQGARFRPAMIEGIGVPVWASFPVAYDPRRR